MVGLTRPLARVSTQQVATDGMRAGPVTVGMRQLVLRGTRLTATLGEAQSLIALAVERLCTTAPHSVPTAPLGQQVSFQIVRPFLTLRFSATQSQRTQFT